MRLTFNPEQDYWPTYTQDGKGILYAYIPVPPLDVLDDSQHRHDRCIGLLPAAGGTRLWSLCDDRIDHPDSNDSFPAYALQSGGRLIYLQVNGRRGTLLGAEIPHNEALWVADTAAPFRRQLIASLPIQIGDSTVNWLADLAWVGSDQFIALGQHLDIKKTINTCIDCIPPHIDDSVWTGIAILRGVVQGTGGSIMAIPGTELATSYAVAEGGSLLVFSRPNDARLYRIAIAGGTPTVVATLQKNSINGVSCLGTLCVVSTGDALWRVDLANPAPTVLRAVSPSDAMYATPTVSPIAGDIVMQVRGNPGHLRTTYARSSDLYLFGGILH